MPPPALPPTTTRLLADRSGGQRPDLRPIPAVWKEVSDRGAARTRRVRKVVPSRPVSADGLPDDVARAVPGQESENGVKTRVAAALLAAAALAGLLASPAAHAET